MYSAVPIISRQRLASIQAEAVSFLIVRHASLCHENKVIQREYALQAESVDKILENNEPSI
jgi:hypothetical protein